MKFPKCYTYQQKIEKFKDGCDDPWVYDIVYKILKDAQLNDEEFVMKAIRAPSPVRRAVNIIKKEKGVKVYEKIMSFLNDTGYADYYGVV